MEAEGAAKATATVVVPSARTMAAVKIRDGTSMTSLLRPRCVERRGRFPGDRVGRGAGWFREVVRLRGGSYARHLPTCRQAIRTRLSFVTRGRVAPVSEGPI